MCGKTPPRSTKLRLFLADVKITVIVCAIGTAITCGFVKILELVLDHCYE